jgi:hypothetical protein
MMIMVSPVSRLRRKRLMLLAARSACNSMSPHSSACRESKAAHLLHLHDLRRDRYLRPPAAVAAAVGAGVRVVNFKVLLGGGVVRCKLMLLLLLLFDLALSQFLELPQQLVLLRQQQLPRESKNQNNKTTAFQPPQNETVNATAPGDCQSCR